MVSVVSALPTKEAICWKQHIVFHDAGSLGDLCSASPRQRGKAGGLWNSEGKELLSLYLWTQGQQTGRCFVPTQADTARTMHKPGRGCPDHFPALSPGSLPRTLSAAGPSPLSRQRRGRSLSSRDPGRACTCRCALRSSGCLPRVATSPPQGVSGEGAGDGGREGCDRNIHSGYQLLQGQFWSHTTTFTSRDGSVK